MTEREKIIELARECGIKNRGFPKSEVWGYEHNIEAFYHAAQADAFDQAAKLCDEQQLEPECPERTSYCANAIRQLGKEK